MPSRRNLLLALLPVALIAPAPLVAQVNPAQPSPAGSAVYDIPPSGADCPIALHARHQSFPALRVTRDGHAPDPNKQQPSQHIHLSLGNAQESVHVAAATVTVRGTGANWILQPASQSSDATLHSSPDASSTVKKTFHLVFRPGAVLDSEEAAATDLALAGFSSVQSVTLDSLTYADGSLWTPAAGHTCRTVPDPLMLVDAR